MGMVPALRRRRGRRPMIDKAPFDAAKIRAAADYHDDCALTTRPAPPGSQRAPPRPPSTPLTEWVRLLERPAWQKHAACRGLGPKGPVNFFPERGENQRPALAICATCPVHQECFNYAMEHGEHFGIWSSTERQRRRIRKAAAA